jgi:hypothetical protein
MSSTPTPPSLVQAFALIGDRNTVPIVPSPTPGQASFDLGFPPATMTDPTAGGIPPDGKDLNGILYMMSAHIAWLAAGGQYHFNANVVTVQGGYGIGQILQSAVTPELFFINFVAGNTNNPDSVITGWYAYSPVGGAVGAQSAVLPAGVSSDFALNRGVGFLEANPTAGAANLTGISHTNVTNGQQVIITNLNGANLLTLKANDGSSLPANQFRLITDIALPQYATFTLKYSSTVGVWIPV